LARRGPPPTAPNPGGRGETAARGYFPAGGVSSTGTSNVAGATLPSFQPGNDSVTLALPLPASAGTRTGP